MQIEKKLPEAAVDEQAEKDLTDALLDEALGETFPASDPVSIFCEKQKPSQ